MRTGHTAFILADQQSPTLGRLSRGVVMQSSRGHLCTYQPTAAGYWTCSHNILISACGKRNAINRAQAATAYEQGQEGADGTGRSVVVAPAPPASEMPACPTTAPLAAGGLSEAHARAS